MENEETGGTGQRGGGECLGKCRPSGPRADVTRDAVSIGEAVLRVLDRIEAHLAALPIGKGHAEITRGVQFTPQFVVPVFGQHICIPTGNSDAFNAVELEADGDLQEIGKALCFDARAIDARAGADVDVDRSDAHTRPLALSANQALIRQAPWNARMIAPRAVVYGRMSCMGVSFLQAAWRSFTISESALVSLCSASTVAPFFLRFQREGVVGSTPARSQISDIGTRCCLALANSASMGFVFSMFRHAIGRRA